MITAFSSIDASHAHSLKTLNTLYEFDDFMESVGSVIDLGCGSAKDLEWWATRTTRDDSKIPLNIKCMGVDRFEVLPMAKSYRNMRYVSHDFEQPLQIKDKYDVLWCHDAFQFVIDPFSTLVHWRDLVNDGGMMVLILPQNTNLEFNVQAYDQRDYVYWNWTMVNLIHVLAVTGWDCANGFFLKEPNDPWLHAVVYKDQYQPQDPRSTRWYHLADAGRLPRSAVESVNRHGLVRQRDLVLPWLDRGVRSLAQQ